MQKPMLDRQDMIRFLGDVISTEMEKPDGDIDMDLVMECEEYLAELLSDVKFPDKQMKRNIAKIKSKTRHTERPFALVFRMPYMRKIVAAACAAVILAGGAITTSAFAPSFWDLVRCVLNLDFGTSVDDGGVTYINRGETHGYQTIDELIQQEEIDILYPHDLPEHLKIKSITSAGEEQNLKYSVAFVDGTTGISINPDELDVSTLFDQTEKFVNSKNITSYIKIRRDTVVSTTVHNGWTYYITATTMDDMKIILENLY